MGEAHTRFKIGCFVICYEQTGGKTFLRINMEYILYIIFYFKIINYIIYTAVDLTDMYDEGRMEG